MGLVVLSTPGPYEPLVTANSFQPPASKSLTSDWEQLLYSVALDNCNAIIPRNDGAVQSLSDCYVGLCCIFADLGAR